MPQVLVKVENLKKHFPVQKSLMERLLTRKLEYVKAVDGVDFEINSGEIFSLVGESGCGKTTVGMLILRLLEPTNGRIIFKGRDITHLKGEELRALRREMQVVFQDPYASLNPRMKIGKAIAHPLEIHNIAEENERKELVLDMLEKVGLTPAEKFYNSYPHQLSGGQRQRVVIARAMILKPSFIVADEAVSMIDVSIRTSILELMLRLKNEFNCTYLFITHDLAIAKYISDKIAVMYLGKIVEKSNKKNFFSNPMHPYSKALLSAVPTPKPKVKKKRMIIGEISSAAAVPKGCRFHPRCQYAKEICKKEEPKLIEVEKNHFVACHLCQSS